MTINFDHLRKVLPKGTQLSCRKKKGDLGPSLEIEVKITPPISWEKHTPMIDALRDIIGKENIHEFYTETQGHHFYIYVKMPQHEPTEVIL